MLIKDRFDFEQHLMCAWHVVEDLQLTRRFLEQSSGMLEADKDTLDNLLLGLETKYNLLFNEIQEGFELLVKKNIL